MRDWGEVQDTRLRERRKAFVPPKADPWSVVRSEESIKTGSQESESRIEVSGVSGQVSHSLSVFPDTRNLTPDTLNYGAWDMRCFTVIYCLLLTAYY